jgi:beta-lactamase class D
MTGPALLVAAVLMGPGVVEAQVTTPEQWVGCWSLEHMEDWAPAVGQAGFPTGEAAPAPRTVLLDRLPGRPGLLGQGGPRSFRAEWEDPALRNLEAWALRPDDHVYLEASPGVRSVVLLLEGPPEPSIPGRWFFRRTDTAFPEVRALVAANRVTCPEGRGPHREVTRDDLVPAFRDRGVEGSLVVYDAQGRRITRVGGERSGERVAPGTVFGLPAALLALQHGAMELDEAFPWDGTEHADPAWNQDHDLRSGLAAGAPWVVEGVAARVPAGAWGRELGRYGNRQFTGGGRAFWQDGDLGISADEKMAWLVDVIRDRSVPPGVRADGSRIDPVRALAHLLEREEREGIRMHALGGWNGSPGGGVGWKVGWVEGPEGLVLFALNLSLPDGQAGPVAPDLPAELARELLEALEVLPVLP